MHDICENMKQMASLMDTKRDASFNRQIKDDSVCLWAVGKPTFREYVGLVLSDNQGSNELQYLSWLTLALAF